MSKSNHLGLIKMNSGTFESHDGTKIYYEVRGEGEPIVFVYGIACLMNHWRYQIDHFAKSHQVISFDLRGHHQSAVPKDNEQLTLLAIGKDLSFLLRTLGLKQAHFVGHSFGVPAMLAAYQESPAIFKSLAFINGFSKNPIKGMFGLDVVEPFFHFLKNQFEQNPLLWNSLWKAAVDNPLSMWFSTLAGGFNFRVTQFKDIEIYAKGVSQIPLGVFLPLFEDMMHFQGDAIAASVERPTLIMSGEQDMVTPQRFQKALHAKIAGSSLVTIPYGSHCCQLDFPDYVNLKLEEFFQSTVTSA
jgi:pimeloyl-ACP methyl ester carboxylesterase